MIAVEIVELGNCGAFCFAWRIYLQICTQPMSFSTSGRLVHVFFFFFFFFIDSSPLSCLVRANTRQRWTEQAGVAELHRGGRLRHAGRHRLGQEHSPHQGENTSASTTTFRCVTWYFAMWRQCERLRRTSPTQEKAQTDKGHLRCDSVMETWSQMQFKVLPVSQKWKM